MALEHVTRTAYGALLQSCQILDIPYTIPEYTTLNEKFGIQAGESLPPNTFPTIKYYCIGNGGHTMTMGADNIPLIRGLQHKATDAALFNQLPFVLRQIGDDLSPTDRAKYALRKEIVVSEVTYIAYYLRRVTMDDVTAILEYRNVNGDIVTVTPFVPTADNLNPTPTIINNSGVNTVSGDYITCTSKLPVTFSPTEVAELLNVAEILYGDENYAIISEFGLCSGYDKTVSITPSSGISFNFNEAIGVQIVSHVGAFHSMRYLSNGLEKLLDVGSSLPLLSIV